MKLKIFFLLCFLISIVFISNATNPIHYQFSSTSKIDSIQIHNLDNPGSYTFINQSDFYIFFDAPTRVSNELYSKDVLTVRTGRPDEPVCIDFTNSVSGKVNAGVFDLQGRTVATFNGHMDAGAHQFQFKPSGAGVYVVRVASTTSHLQAKFFAYSPLTAPQLKLSSPGKHDNTTVDKPFLVSASSTTEPMVIRRGDLLRIVVCSESKKQVYYQYAYSDLSFQVNFQNPHHRFTSYGLYSSQPAFVDALFSVSSAQNLGVDHLTNEDFIVKENEVLIPIAESFRYIRKVPDNPQKTILMLDNSVSLQHDLPAVKKAFSSFIRKIRPNQQIAVLVFSDRLEVMQDFTSDTLKLQQAVSSITTGFASSNLYGSLISALSKWTDEFTLEKNIQGSLILVADGNDTQASSTLNEVIAAKGNKKVYVIGLGDQYTSSVFNQIASIEKRYSPQSVDKLEGLLYLVQSDIVRSSNSFYRLTYMSPKRAYSYALQVTTAGNTNTDNSRHLAASFDATGFQSVVSGVYINPSQSKPYGVDSIYCIFKDNKYYFASTRNGSYLSTDSLTLRPFTYWASKAPVYKWELADDQYFSITSLHSGYGMLKGSGNASATTMLTIQDVANGYSKQIVLRMIADERLLTGIQLVTNYTEGGVPVVPVSFINGATAPVKKVLFSDVNLTYRFTPATADVSTKTWSFVRTSQSFAIPGKASVSAQSQLFAINDYTINADGTGNFALKVSSWSEPPAGQRHMVALQADDTNASGVAPVVSDYAKVEAIQHTAFISDRTKWPVVKHFPTTMPYSTIFDFELVYNGAPVNMKDLVMATCKPQFGSENQFEYYGFTDYVVEYSSDFVVTGPDGLTNQNSFISLQPNGDVLVVGGVAAIDRSPKVKVTLKTKTYGDVLQVGYVSFKIKP
jgi:hypothetical protein